MPELIDEEVTGLLVPPGDAVALAKAIGLLIGNPDLRRQMSAAAQKKVQSFKASTVVPRIEQIYSDIAVKYLT